MRLKRFAIRHNRLYKVAVRVRVGLELIYLSTGSIHCCCETFELLDFHEAPSSNTNSFITLFIMLFYATSYLNYLYSVIISPSIVITVLGIP